MKKFGAFLGVSALALSIVSCTTKPIEYAMITDVGNIDDRSFNQGTWEGMEAWAEGNKVESADLKYFKPATANKADYISTINNSIKAGAKIVVCPGFLFEEAVHAAQSEHKDVKFVILDGAPHKGDLVSDIKDNTVSIMFEEHESGFLAGYAAVKEGFTKLGYTGGMAVPAVVKFGIGYVAGAYKAAAEMENKDFNLPDNRYTYFGGFDPSDTNKALAASWYGDGTEVIFSCAGGAGSSVMAAAAEKEDKWVIGVDVDQSSQSKTVLTSAMKGLAAGVKTSLDAYKADKWSDVGGKQIYLSAKNNGVGLPTHKDAWRMKNFTVENYNELYKKVQDEVEGYKVPNDYASLKSYVEGLSYTLNLKSDTITPKAD